MKNKVRKFSKKMYVFLILFFGLSALGVTYASWSSNLQINTQISTGAMDILFDKQQDEKYIISITDADDNIFSPIKAEFNVLDKEKELEILFGELLPIEKLIQGKMLKLEFPLEPSNESTITKLKPTKLDMSKEGEILEMKARNAILAKDGIGYFLKNSGRDFMLPLKFEVYRTLNADKEDVKEDIDDMNGEIYLKLKEESIEQLKLLPTNLKIGNNELEDNINLTLKEKELVSTAGNGIIVIYSCEIPFSMFQNEAEEKASAK
ncbi:hypothetical protein HMPREF9629_00470 [Peptoanaerobacter stomatis]|uniref:Uncharacterized protein n=1 Tax=Peptoanaerobacter stomatis TaxID=796937 RepID=G9X247_9FIRM|nr:hypothetical protein [Peptoanaerobacter stomatis]EHL13170.1 hypothetical protein HMPREF9629_00470 [Peptoanaerobacter stomatis]